VVVVVDGVVVEDDVEEVSVELVELLLDDVLLVLLVLLAVELVLLEVELLDELELSVMPPDFGGSGPSVPAKSIFIRFTMASESSLSATSVRPAPVPFMVRLNETYSAPSSINETAAAASTSSSV